VFTTEGHPVPIEAGRRRAAQQPPACAPGDPLEDAGDGGGACEAGAGSRVPAALRSLRLAKKLARMRALYGVPAGAGWSPRAPGRPLGGARRKRARATSPARAARAPGGGRLGAGPQGGAWCRPTGATTPATRPRWPRACARTWPRRAARACLPPATRATRPTTARARATPTAAPTRGRAGGGAARSTASASCRSSSERARRASAAAGLARPAAGPRRAGLLRVRLALRRAEQPCPCAGCEQHCVRPDAKGVVQELKSPGSICDTCANYLTSSTQRASGTAAAQNPNKHMLPPAAVTELLQVT